MRKKSIYTPRYRLLIRLLREARAEANITQEEVAKRIGCTESQVSRWENCLLRIDLRDLDEFLSAIESDLVEFVTRWRRLADDLEGADVEVKLTNIRRARPYGKSPNDKS